MRATITSPQHLLLVITARSLSYQASPTLGLPVEIGLMQITGLAEHCLQVTMWQPSLLMLAPP